MMNVVLWSTMLVVMVVVLALVERRYLFVHGAFFFSPVQQHKLHQHHSSWSLKAPQQHSATTPPQQQQQQQQQPPSSTSTSKTTSLYGISEWRDSGDFESVPSTAAAIKVSPNNNNNNKNANGNFQPPPIREICVLPFPYQDVLLQGETKQLRLYEDRFLQLFDECMTKQSSVVAMGLLADGNAIDDNNDSGGGGIIQTVPLCEVEDYVRVDGFGIFVSIRVVGRASLVEIIQQEPYIKASCTERFDEGVIPKKDIELANVIADHIEMSTLKISAMERRLKQQLLAKEEEEEEEEGDDVDLIIQDEDGTELVFINVDDDNFAFTTMDDDDEEDDEEDDHDKDEEDYEDEEAALRRRILRANLSDFDDDDDDEDEDDEDEDDLRALSSRFQRTNDDDDVDDDDDEDDDELDRATKFRQAYQVALATDTQGYTTTTTTTTTTTKGKNQSIFRSVRELTALSWASFCTAETNFEKNYDDFCSYRIRALDSDDLMERLKLATFMLRELSADLKANMKKSGIDDLWNTDDNGNTDNNNNNNNNN